ncbi:MAG: flagellar basal body rod protein FlgC [Nitrosospira sp. 56-18]|jgi:flagellar basal-body rod protein FlgC|nr:flagellar basal body rod protein FlgC [Nitrosospira sp.]OJY15399.1 MAG: flagellar basal body rod protein FlgC [Nitrosospira sp. 56-18]
MSLFSIFDVAGSAMTAQNKRLNVVASNLANADSAASSNGEAYKAKQVVFTTQSVGAQAAAGLPADGMNGVHGSYGTAGVRVSAVIEDQSPMRKVFEPGHPMADKDGFVTMPNVNVVEEMVNMISASRSYQNNVDMMNTAKTLLLKTLTIGQ